MIEVKDRSGQRAWVSYIHDCGENAGGFYCETYADPDGNRKVDDFCIHPGDFQPYGGKDFYDRLEEHIRHVYDNETLNLNYCFS